MMRYLKIAIDKGHNCPPDIGAQSYASEDKITKAVGDRIIELLARTSIMPVDVTPTKASSVGNSLAKRIMAARGCGLFLSIHANAAGNSQAKGSECYYFKGNERTKKLATLLSSEVAKVLATNNRGAKEGNFYVLRETPNDAVLLELGFVTNEKEAKAMLEKTDEMAECIVKALLSFIGYKEDSIALTPPKLGLKPLVAKEYEYEDQVIDYSVFNKGVVTEDKEEEVQEEPKEEAQEATQEEAQETDERPTSN